MTGAAGQLGAVRGREAGGFCSFGRRICFYGSSALSGSGSGFTGRLNRKYGEPPPPRSRSPTDSFPGPNVLHECGRGTRVAAEGPALTRCGAPRGSVNYGHVTSDTLWCSAHHGLRDVSVVVVSYECPCPVSPLCSTCSPFPHSPTPLSFSVTPQFSFSRRSWTWSYTVRPFPTGSRRGGTRIRGPSVSFGAGAWRGRGEGCSLSAFSYETSLKWASLGFPSSWGPK